MTKPYPYLISRWADAVFAIAVGTGAYFMYEQRVGRPEGHTLVELVSRKVKSWKGQE